jgi:NAD(P)-dependent dehydrogenase (short-subunit alcohol dehydrogenase family)
MMGGKDLQAMADMIVPMGRFAQPDEVAKLALWLASDDSAFANGADFVLDGGQTA